MPKSDASSSRPAQANAETQASRARTLAIELARSLAGDKCEDITVLDVHDLSQICDFILVASGTSERQMRSALANAVELAEESGHTAMRVSDASGSNWVLADFVDVVVHVFEPNTRAFYDLEMLWGDAEHIPWSPDGVDGGTRDRAGLEGEDFSSPPQS